MTRERYYKLGPSIWLQPWDDTTRLCALYLLTSPHRSTEGLFRLPIDYAAHDLGWPKQRFAKAFNELLADGFIEWDAEAQVVLIVNALQWQAPQNPNQVEAAMRVIRALPSTPLLDRFQRLAQQFAERLHKELVKEFGVRLGEGFAHPPAHSSNSLSNGLGIDLAVSPHSSPR